MSKAKFEAAKELIQSKHYNEARAILKTIDHPVAKEWLAKIDNLDPFGSTAKPDSTYRKSPLPLVVLAAVLVLVVVALGLLYTQRSNIPQVAALLSSPTPAPTETPSATVTPVGCSLSRDEQDTLTEFLDTAQTANTTARINLTTVITDMQKSHRHFTGLDHQPCAKNVIENIDRGMDNVIQGFQDFQGKDEVMSNIDFDYASRYFYDADTRAAQLGMTIKDYRIYDTNVFLFHRPSAITPAPTTIPMASS